VFTRTKHGANRLVQQLEKDGLSAAAIHGNKSQGARTRALAAFKDKTIRVLVATDIAARGLDIDQLPHVINYELPNVPEDYVHRIGRTGRAGNEGEAISLVCVDELKLLADIEKLLKRDIPKKVESGYEVDPSIKAEPVQKGRNNKQTNRRKASEFSNEHKTPKKSAKKNRNGKNNENQGNSFKSSNKNASKQARPNTRNTKPKKSSRVASILAG
jgi:ATP-dependent RNA helicase RhlE